MIRKIFLLTAVFFLFVYACWNFYTKAAALDPLSEVTVSPQAPKAAQARTGAEYRPAWSRDIIEKNLFSPSRTYAPPKPAAAAALPPEKRPEFALKGIVLDAFGDYVAYVSIDKAKPVAVRKGDKIEKTEIVDVSARQAVLKWNGEVIDLSMERIKTIDNAKAAK
ncbi:MAG: hypothetical protein M0Z60_04430 [Nitrospiraceae bacterium]|nr:hypothetical protein [Nitrospiraceae bacterium]